MYDQQLEDERVRNVEEQLKLLYDFAKQITTIATATSVILITVSTNTERGVPTYPLFLLATSAAGALYSMILANWILRRIHLAWEARRSGNHVSSSFMGTPGWWRWWWWGILILIDLYAVTALVSAVVVYARPDLLVELFLDRPK